MSGHSKFSSSLHVGNSEMLAFVTKCFTGILGEEVSVVLFSQYDFSAPIIINFTTKTNIVFKFKSNGEERRERGVRREARRGARREARRGARRGGKEE